MVKIKPPSIPRRKDFFKHTNIILNSKFICAIAKNDVKNTIIACTAPIVIVPWCLSMTPLKDVNETEIRVHCR